MTTQSHCAHRSIFRSLAAVALLAASGSSFAQLAVIDAPVLAAVNAASTAIVTAVRTSAAATTSTLTTSMTTQTSNLQSVMISAQSATSATIREATGMASQVQMRIAAVMERGRQDDRYQMSEPCTAAAAAAAAPSAHEQAVAALTAAAATRSGGGSAPPRPGASGSLSQALDVAQGRVAAPAPEISAQAGARAGCESFTSSGLRNTACTVAGFSPRNAVGFENADIKADTLLDGPQGATAKVRSTINMDTQEGTAVQAYMRNIATPIKLRDLKAGELGTDAGRRYMGAKDVYDAQISLANRPIAFNLRQKTASPATLEYVNALLSGSDAAFVTAHLTENAPQWRNKGISSDEIMDIEVRRRYNNPAWQVRMAAAPPEEAAKENLQVSAYTNVLLRQLIREVRELGAATSQIALSQTRTEMASQGEASLTALHGKATGVR